MFGTSKKDRDANKILSDAGIDYQVGDICRSDVSDSRSAARTEEQNGNDATAAQYRREAKAMEEALRIANS